MEYRIEQSADGRRVKLTVDDMFVIELNPAAAYWFGQRIGDFARNMGAGRDPASSLTDTEVWPFTAHAAGAPQAAADD
jgi:hypothetical protein